ncbi:hypothetical protein VTL71DRAFT_8528 [Oculimacula yallundae]|uniref:N-acetyltransferase domain-containing protein n=1 Tax=Oculimacula yallundae TaxID=86028 RepID=A0ABR4D091_9HELO
MPHSEHSREKVPPPNAKYVPLGPEKAKTREELLDEETAHAALQALAESRATLYSGCQLSLSRWAPQNIARFEAAVPKPVKNFHGASGFSRNAAKSGVKIALPAAPVRNAAVLNTPPTTPKSNLNARAPIWVSGGSQGPVLSTVTDFTPNPNHSEHRTIASSVSPVAIRGKSIFTTVVPSQSFLPQIAADHVQSLITDTQLQSIQSATLPAAGNLSGAGSTTYIPPHLWGKAAFKASPTPNSAPTSAAQKEAYVPPHLWGKAPPKSSPSLSSAPALPPVQKADCIPPHLRRAPQMVPAQVVATSNVQPVLPSPQSIPPHLRHLQKSASIPPHLRGPPAQFVSSPNQAIHQNAPPQLRSTSLQNSSSFEATTLSHNNTPSAKGIETVMAPSFAPPVRPLDPEQDAFLKWLNGKNAAKKVATVEKTTEKTTEKIAEKIIVKTEKASNPVRSPQVSPSSKSITSKVSQISPMQHINDTDPFLEYMKVKKVTKHYGVPPKKTSPTDGWKRPRTAFDNPKWKLNDDTVNNFEAYIRGSSHPSAAHLTAQNTPPTIQNNIPTAQNNPPTAQNNTVYGSASVRAAKVEAAQVTAPNSHTYYQKPTFVGVQKLGQNKQVVNGPAQVSNTIKPAEVVVKVEKAVHGPAQKQPIHVPATTQIQPSQWQVNQPVEVAVKSENTGPSKVVQKQPVHAPATFQTQQSQWNIMPSMKSVAAMISADVNNIQPDNPSNAPPLTENALVLQTGFKTVNENNITEDGISSTGLGDVSSGYAQDPRHTQGNATVEQLADWDGTWAPAPVNWETERTLFDAAFVPEYIKEWQRTIPLDGSAMIDITSEKFSSLKPPYSYPIANTIFLDQVDQGEDTVPDNAENTQDQELKRRWQTAAIEANNYLVAFEKKQQQEKRALKASNMRFHEIAEQEPEKNPFAPAIDIYLRPAEEKDAADVVAIYNWYISNTDIPEDQTPIGIEDGKWLIKQAKDDKMPFLVAVKGRQPASVDAQGRPSPSNKIIMPVVESVIGFCFPERFNYGFSASWKGRSRATVTLQLYVHHEHTRKGVGRNLLDRLIHCLTPGYAYRNAASWINPSHDKLYETEGAGMFHQLLFQIPVEAKHDPNIEWLTKFLFKFLFKESTFKERDPTHPKRLRSVARSSIKGRTAHFLNLAVFQYEARQEGEFDPYM